MVGLRAGPRADMVAVMSDVIQSDRDAAVEIAVELSGVWSWRDQYRSEVLSGRRDSNATVQAFAGHRIASEAALRERVAVLEGAGQFLVDRIADLETGAASVGDMDGYWREWNGHVDPALSRFRAALTTLKGTPDAG